MWDLHGKLTNSAWPSNAINTHLTPTKLSRSRRHHTMKLENYQNCQIMCRILLLNSECRVHGPRGLPLSHAASIHFKINNTLTVDPPALIHWATFDPSFSINSGNTDVRNTKFNGHKNEVWEEILAKTQIMPCDSKRYFQQRSAFLSKHLFVWRFSGDYLYMLHT